MTPSPVRFRTKAVLVAFAVIAALCAWIGTDWFRHPSTDGGSALGPLSAYALPASQRSRFEGRVLERVRASSYAYLLVERDNGERSWVVTLASSAGARSSTEKVSVLALGYAQKFRSKRLGRNFDGLYFAVVRPG
jgi:hypothetical protein